jgi:large subunit ribosomal protein L35
MGYKLKTNKSVKSRFKVTATGKLKRHHAKTSHLMSARSAKKRRQLGRPAIVSETHARRLRRLLGKHGLHPGQPRRAPSAPVAPATPAPQA